MRSSFNEKVDRLVQPTSAGQSGGEVRMSSGELTAAIAQASGMLPYGGGFGLRARRRE